VTKNPPRSERQGLASRANGAKGRGPSSPEGKARSAQNPRKHGLTGEIDPTQAEQAETEELVARLRARYPDNDPEQAMLKDRVVTATLRLNRARALITETLEGMANSKKDWRAAHKEQINKAVEDTQSLFEAAFGRGPPSRSLAKFYAEQIGLITNTSPPSRASMTRLMQYAQRFRGERDRALTRLEAMRKRVQTHQQDTKTAAPDSEQ